MTLRRKLFAAAAGVAVLVGVGVLLAQEYKSGIVWPEPPVVTPAKADAPAAPPSDAIVLFDGKTLEAWDKGENWEIKDGYAIARKSVISTKQSFGDIQLHLEFATPEKVDPNAKGQARGNNGVNLMGKYEVQILDSFENPTYFDGQCGAVYKQQPPMVNACRKPGEWQTYDIVFEAPRFDADGKVTKPAVITAFQNGVLIQNHFQLTGGTSYTAAPSYTKHADKLPLQLYYHGNDVRFRNIWVRELKPIVGKEPAKKDEPKKDGE